MLVILKHIKWPSLLHEYKQLMQPADDISLEKHVQLLRMTFERILYSFLVIPFTAVLAALLYGSEHDALLMYAWALVYVGVFFYRIRLKKLFEDDVKLLNSSELLTRWLPKLKIIVTLHGLGLCMPLLLTATEPSYEFTLIWYMILAGITAINATLLTAVLSIFVRFLSVIGLISSVYSVFAFPKHWYYITPIFIFFLTGFYRYALVVHKFFLQQVRLEESSTRLAEQFKIAKEAAEDALRSKNRFLTTASHDLRQPVHAMSMLTEAISQRNKDESLMPALADMRLSMRSMNLMFNSLLDLSKLESGVIQVEHKSVHLQPFLQDLAKLFEPDARDRHLQLRLHLPREAAYAKTDANLLRQVILNLTQNALRYTLKGGVLLALRKRGDSWQIEVCDTGIGVAKDKQANIYLPYFRDQHAWSIDSEGHGLGLSVVARCALLLKSPLDMDSRLGRGSRFWIRVPSVADVPSISSDTSDAYASSNTLLPINTGRCLIVEDDPQVSRAWEALMLSWGIELQIASNSSEAFACLRSGFIPQAILCDERLRAGESGFDLLKALLAKLPDARGAMVSGEFNAPALVQAEEEGYLVLRKPVDIGIAHDLLVRWLIR